MQLTALGIGLIFGVMRLINFAHSGADHGGGICASSVLRDLVAIALVAAIVAAVVLALIIERAVFRSARRRPRRRC